uniref:putative wall-associated receptor kinase-like 16 isoform X2 n=1 Tax=Erigeron canadensis TaxID=72917 RepID=UPI001CB9480A|nr:putative wall-associated receptor kinase-like 16 isoform X2 [Erigeron canadensis]
MKYSVLAIVLMLSFTASTNLPSPYETYTLINATGNLAKPGCESRCGDLIVPYPFGIGLNSNCSIGHGFDIHCNTSLDPPRASLTESDYVSIRLISDSTLRTSNLVASTCYNHKNSTDSYGILAKFASCPYTFSQANKFTVIGCYDYAWLNSGTESRNVSTGCMAFCTEPDDALSKECPGNGCCQSPIPKDMSYYETQIDSLQGPDEMNSSKRCAYAFVGDEKEFKFNDERDLKNHDSFVSRIEATVPVVLDWAIGNVSCVEAERSYDYACRSNSKCVNSTRKSGGYLCLCKEGYRGNPYLLPGCQGTALVLLTILIALVVSYLIAKKRKLMKQREKFFEQNGGTLLKEKLKTKGGVVVGSMTIFCVEDLEKATNNFAESKILGRGGNGTVYKGTLPDKRVVAIKKSQGFDQEQREQFINEMVILTQINHQNVVQLLGCCLETDVPLLVYEFVSNDTLYYHIHEKNGGLGRLSWDHRLRIAHESASALAYLHTDTRMAIIHRDVKSTNILLDGNYTAKIADFGASRLVPLGHDQVTTLVQGTFGYLDPEYFHSGHLTDKSDVYSFGVVLAELLTGKKPLCVERFLEDRNLATHFVKARKENRLAEIVDLQVIKEATVEQLKAACDLACRCLRQVGANRPSMKEVTLKLDTLRKLGNHPFVSEENHDDTSSLLMEMESTTTYTFPTMGNTDSDAFGGKSKPHHRDAPHSAPVIKN